MKRGFTLIELSIVLVIIGLIVGGVLVGRDLIQGAKIRQQISQLESYDTAVTTFRNKFNCIPGDCRAFTKFGFGNNCPVTNGNGMWEGNGDGVIDDQSATGDRYESYGVPCALRDANLRAFNPTLAAPSEPLTMTRTGDLFAALDSSMSTTLAAMSVVSSNYNNYYGHLFMGCGGSGVCAPFTTLEALAIDTKIDNGQPTTGKVQATFSETTPFYLSRTLPGWAGASPATNCIDAVATPNIYKTTYLTYKACALVYKLSSVPQ